jgi:DNA-binding transcriptional regulator YdaS (Cro superfamily)
MITIAQHINAVGGRTAVARKLGIPYSTVNWWYTANRIPSRDQAARLADLCGVSVNTLWRQEPTAHERRQRYVECAINELERAAFSTITQSRQIEIKRAIAGLYSVLAHMAPRRYMGAPEGEGVADNDSE